MQTTTKKKTEYTGKQYIKIVGHDQKTKFKNSWDGRELKCKLKGKETYSMKS
jgi:hypothetical protein